MVRVERSIKIASTQRDVFGYVADYNNVPAFMHNVTRFEPIGEKHYGLGARFYWETVVKGLRLGWQLVVTEFSPFQWMAAEAIAAPRSSSNWRFRSSDGGTLATFATAVELPRGLLLGHWLVERDIASSMERSLLNLRRVLESAPPPARPIPL